MTFSSIHITSKHSDSLFESAPSDLRSIMSEGAFKQAIALERKRSERSKESFMLLLLRTNDSPTYHKSDNIINIISSALMPFIRETDTMGWFTDRVILGVIFTALGDNSHKHVVSTMLQRISAILGNQITSDQLHSVSISFHFFPDNWEPGGSNTANNTSLYSDLQNIEDNKKLLLGIKRGMDIIGSILFLILSAPLLVLIALAIKASSKGPVIYKQERVGLHGRQFTFFKFRSMYCDSDTSVHRNFAVRLITNRGESNPLEECGKGIYKLTNDKRITRVGRILRRFSLDELPQLFNVLAGDMSLVVPRPPIPYELAAYQIWHRRRLLEVKPGITGLWQVTGRSRVKFDEMVRLDLRYAASWSPKLDLSILMRTPFAVIKGQGAC